MRLIIVSALSLFFTGVVTGSAYQYVRRCKSHTEPCINLRCTSSGQSVQIPTYSLYSCCANKIFDERNYVCVKINGVTRAKSCNPCTQFRCGNSQCVLKGWRCDKKKDCKDGSDEVGCGSCWSYQFRCANGRCIHRDYVCDKKNNCGDGSDELGCLRKNGGSCGSRYFRCSNDRCIPKSWVCDRYDDCRDNSDERGCISYGKKRNTIPGLDEKQSDQKKGKPVDAAASTIAS